MDFILQSVILLLKLTLLGVIKFLSLNFGSDNWGEVRIKKSSGVEPKEYRVTGPWNG